MVRWSSHIFFFFSIIFFANHLNRMKWVAMCVFLCVCASSSIPCSKDWSKQFNFVQIEFPFSWFKVHVKQGTFVYRTIWVSNQIHFRRQQFSVVLSHVFECCVLTNCKYLKIYTKQTCFLSGTDKCWSQRKILNFLGRINEKCESNILSSLQ